VDGPVAELSFAAAKQPQLAVGIIAAVPDVPAHEKIFARHPIAIGLGRMVQDFADFFDQARLERLVGIQRKHPVTLGVLDGGIFLGGIALPDFQKDFSAVTLRDLYRAISAAAISQHDLALAVLHQLAHRVQRAPEVGLLVVGNDHDGE